MPPRSQYIWKHGDTDERIQARVHPNDPVPEGWQRLPLEFDDNPGAVFLVDGVLTTEEPNHIRERDRSRIKVSKKIREMAIEKLKADGDIPPDYEEND